MKKWEKKAHWMEGPVCPGLAGTAWLLRLESHGLAGASKAGGEAVGSMLEGM